MQPTTATANDDATAPAPARQKQFRPRLRPVQFTKRDRPGDEHPGSLQSVQTWVIRRVRDETHPDDRHLYSEEVLSEPTGDEDRVRVWGKRADERSESSSLIGFETEAQELADLENAVRRVKKEFGRAAKLKRRAERLFKGPKDAVEVDPQEAAKARREAEKHSRTNREMKEMIADRMEHGAYYAGGRIAGEIVPRMHEYLGANCKNMRSRTGSPSLARMAALYPRKGRVRAGYEKDVLLDSATKIFALDAPYAELNKRIIGCIVVELDSTLLPEEFREELLIILGSKMMPNLIVGRINHDGRLVRPHLIWILTKPVWNDLVREVVDPSTGELVKVGDPRCKPKPIAKARMVQRCLTSLLLPLGADPAMTNMTKPKNALSFFWTTLITNDERFHMLDDFSDIKGWPKKVDEHAMAEAAAKVRAEAKSGRTASNLAWNVVTNIIHPLARHSLRDGDPAFIKAGQAGVDELAAWFDSQVRPAAREALLLAAQEAAEAEKAAAEAEDANEEADTIKALVAEIIEKTTKALDIVLERRCRFAARWCLGKLSKRRRKSYRGRDRNVVFKDNPNPTEKERQQKASELTAQGRRARSAWALAKEASTALSDTGEIRKADFIKDATTVRRATAYRRWDQAMALLGLVEFAEGVWRKPAAVTAPVSLGVAKIKSETSSGSHHPTSIPSAPIQASDSTRSPAQEPRPLARTDDPPRLDTDAMPPEPGVDDPPWVDHATPTVDVRQRVVRCAPELEPA